MNSPLISIIVPVYNVERYLPKCLDSIQAQTFTDFEAVLVDDGSTDGSGRICDEYATKDKRFKVIHKENGGVSSARNKGLEECRGQWCCFVDSDDWLDPAYLQNFMVDDFERYGCIIQGFYKESEIQKQSYHCAFQDKDIQTASELLYILEKTPLVKNGYLWHRIFRMQTIKDNNLKFPVGISFAEDGIFILNFMCYADYFRLTSTVGYHYMLRNNTLRSKGMVLLVEKYYDTLGYISEATQKIADKDEPDEIIANWLKLFLWRILFSWIVCWSMTCKDDYNRNQKFFLSYLKKYPINLSIKTDTIALKYIIAIVSKKPSAFRYFLLCGLRKGYFIERKIRRLLTFLRQSAKR